MSDKGEFIGVRDDSGERPIILRLIEEGRPAFSGLIANAVGEALVTEQEIANKGEER